MLIVQQKMLYQKHSLGNLNFHVQTFFMKIQPFISSLWQERWDKEVGNKLHAIMPQIDEKYYSGCTNRKDEVIINRLRIGHTRLTHSFRMENRSHPPLPPKVLLLCRSWGACVPRRSQRLCQLEFWLLVGTTMLDRIWARGQTKCNTLLMLATSVFGRIHRWPCYVMAQPKSRLDIPWPNDAECMGHVWYHFSCWYPLLLYVESLAGCFGG